MIVCVALTLSLKTSLVYIQMDNVIKKCGSNGVQMFWYLKSLTEKLLYSISTEILQNIYTWRNNQQPSIFAINVKAGTLKFNGVALIKKGPNLKLFMSIISDCNIFVDSLPSWPLGTTTWCYFGHVPDYCFCSCNLFKTICMFAWWANRLILKAVKCLDEKNGKKTEIWWLWHCATSS